MTNKDNISNSAIFDTLFRAAYFKCFDHTLESVPPESDCKHLSYEIENLTGLVIGWRSVKNYCIALTNTEKVTKTNPSIPTLDTFSRYVLEAPLSNEVQRKELKEPYIYWYRYREEFLQKRIPPDNQKKNIPNKKSGFLFLLGLLLIIVPFVLKTKNDLSFTEEFKTLSEEKLKAKGWKVLNKNQTYWDKRSGHSDRLTLFTLYGDNWYYENNIPKIENLVYRKIPKGNFSAEIHFSEFIPKQNWQQAGLLIMEDTLLRGKSIRISLGYNDYFGGIDRPGEILVQGISSNGFTHKNSEEFVHLSLFQNDSIGYKIAEDNLKFSALKVEKLDHEYRFLYAASPFHNFSFKEIDTYTFSMDPKFIGIFAIKGFQDSTKTIPVRVSFFRIEQNNQ